MTPDQLDALKAKIAQMEQADTEDDGEIADESVFEDEDAVSDKADQDTAEKDSAVEIKIETEEEKAESEN